MAFKLPWNRNKKAKSVEKKVGHELKVVTKDEVKEFKALKHLYALYDHLIQGLLKDAPSIAPIQVEKTRVPPVLNQLELEVGDEQTHLETAIHEYYKHERDLTKIKNEDLRKYVKNYHNHVVLRDSEYRKEFLQAIRKVYRNKKELVRDLRRLLFEHKTFASRQTLVFAACKRMRFFIKEFWNVLVLLEQKSFKDYNDFRKEVLLPLLSLGVEQKGERVEEVSSELLRKAANG